MTDRELMQQALAALDWAADYIEPRNPNNCDCPICVASDALRERLEQPEQELVAWMQEMPIKGDETRSVRLTTVEALARREWTNPIPLYATPPRPREQPQRTHWEGCEEVHPECRKPETVMAEYKFQTYAAYKTPDGEMKIGVVPEQREVGD